MIASPLLADRQNSGYCLLGLLFLRRNGAFILLKIIFGSRINSMIKNVFRSKSKTVTFAAILLGASALISRLLGLIRDRLLASSFGAGEELDVYFAAFRIPDFVYGIIIMGGISAVFVPVFSKYFLKDEKEGWRLASNVLNVFLLSLIIVCGILAIFTPQLTDLITPGFNDVQKELMISLTRIMFLSPILFGISSIFSGILHYFDRFLVYGLAPILYNLGIILGIVFLYPLFGLHGLIFGVILGAALHLLIQVPAAISSGFRYHLIFDLKSSGLKNILKLMTPRVAGTAALQINLVVVTAIASTLTAGSIAVFNFANNLQSFPIGIIGASFAVAVFPALSKAWAGSEREKFIDNFSATLKQIIFLVIPISALMFLLRAQIVRLILGAGEFSWSDTRLTAASLGIFCLGIFAASLVPFLARVFYSFHNTKTPVAISLASMGLNIILSFLFVWLLSFDGAFKSFFIGFLKLEGIENIAVVGLPLAISIASIFQFLLLLFYLKKEMGRIKLMEVLKSLKKIIIATVFMAAATYFSLLIINPFVDNTTVVGLFIQTAFAFLAGLAAYIASACFLKMSEIKNLCSSVVGQFKKN
jgi:putative peptidoglycan lipid II flippase